MNRKILAKNSTQTDKVAIAASVLTAAKKDNVFFDLPIGEKTTYRAGGSAAIFFRIDELDDLYVLSHALWQSSLEVMCLGKGSNTLVSEKGFSGICCALSDQFSYIETDKNDLTLTCGAAASLPQIARQSAAAGLSGMEWAVGIPGSCGGAVLMNAGGHGSDTATVVGRMDVFDLAGGQLITYQRDEVAFSYRHSSFSGREILLEAVFNLVPGDAQRSLVEIQEIVSWRRQHQPGGKNAGSVFKNPQGISVGKLLDELGLKGFRHRSACVSDKHANFFQLDTGGRSDDVLELIEIVREKVVRETGIVLEPEVKLVGFENLQ
jgi:UDP-N-acetylmuramate dehydrogenase